MIRDLLFLAASTQTIQLEKTHPQDAMISVGCRQVIRLERLQRTSRCVGELGEQIHYWIALHRRSLRFPACCGNLRFSKRPIDREWT